MLGALKTPTQFISEVVSNQEKFCIARVPEAAGKLAYLQPLGSHRGVLFGLGLANRF
jgi:hypothetical protein